MQLKVATYTSFASAGIQATDIAEILRVSRSNNERDGVTGLLIFNGGGFAQVIEGPPDSIDGLVARIRCDPRNCALEIRDEQFLERRIFANWAMGFMHLDSGRLVGDLDLVDALHRPMPAAIHNILQSVAITLPIE